MKMFLEMDWAQQVKAKQNIPGDRVLMKRKGEGDLIILSDGLGSGIKANVLATMTAEMARTYVENHQNITDAARTIMDTLPVCRERKISYSTFTICEISREGQVQLVEYDNPPCLLYRNGKALPLETRDIELNRKQAYKKEQLRVSRVNLQFGDRLIFYSDGISQAGLGTKAHPLGWRDHKVRGYIEELLDQAPELSARDLARRLCARARLLDGGSAKDDISAVVLYYRRPRQLLIVTGPPMDRERDRDMAERITSFPGQVILSGGTTASLVSRELGRKLDINLKERTRDIPPTSSMEGVELVTEGMLTLNRVAEILEERREEEWSAPHGAGRFTSLLIQSDEVRFLVGTRVNEAHHDPSIPEDIGIRRTTVRRIAQALEKQYFKTVEVDYL